METPHFFPSAVLISTLLQPEAGGGAATTNPVGSSQPEARAVERAASATEDVGSQSASSAEDGAPEEGDRVIPPRVATSLVVEGARATGKRSYSEANASGGA